MHALFSDMIEASMIAVDIPLTYDFVCTKQLCEHCLLHINS